MKRNTVKRMDLGWGWDATLWSDGTMTLRSMYERIDLSQESVETLRSIFREAVPSATA